MTSLEMPFDLVPVPYQILKNRWKRLKDRPRFAHYKWQGKPWTIKNLTRYHTPDIANFIKVFAKEEGFTLGDYYFKILEGKGGKTKFHGRAYYGPVFTTLGFRSYIILTMPNAMLLPNGIPFRFLVEFAQVLVHEYQHTLGERHKDMASWRTLSVEWVHKVKGILPAYDLKQVLVYAQGGWTQYWSIYRLLEALPKRSRILEPFLCNRDNIDPKETDARCMVNKAAIHLNLLKGHTFVQGWEPNGIKKCENGFQLKPDLFLVFHDSPLAFGMEHNIISLALKEGVSTFTINQRGKIHEIRRLQRDEH